jgi:hypothetical protein
MTTTKNRHRITGAFAVLAMVALIFGVVVSPPAAQANASPPADQVAYIVPDQVGADSPGTEAASANIQANSQLDYTGATIDVAFTAKAGGYDVVCPITSSQDSITAINVIANITDTAANNANNAGTVTVNAGGLDAKLPITIAQTNSKPNNAAVNGNQNITATITANSTETPAQTANYAARTGPNDTSGTAAFERAINELQSTS